MRIYFFVLSAYLLISFGCKKEVTLQNDTGAVFQYVTAQFAPGVEIGEIYSTKNFAAFTDLAYYDSSWYAVFRMGTAHNWGPNGQIKVLTSTDGHTWKVK